MKRKLFIRKGLVGASIFLSGGLKGSPVTDTPAETTTANDKVPEIINAGIGGNNTADLLERTDRDCLLLKPDLIIFMAGTNDMNSKKFVALPAFEKNMQQMISSMQKIKADVVLMNLLPVYEPYLFTRHDPHFYDPEKHSGRLQQMNLSIKKLAANNKAGLVDLFHVFSKIGNIGLEASSLIKNEANSKTTDGLHPTPDGYRTMAVAVHAALVCRGLANKKKIVCFGDSITRGDGVEGGENYPSYLQKLLSS